MPDIFVVSLLMLSHNIHYYTLNQEYFFQFIKFIELLSLWSSNLFFYQPKPLQPSLHTCGLSVLAVHIFFQFKIQHSSLIIINASICNLTYVPYFRNFILLKDVKHYSFYSIVLIVASAINSDLLIPRSFAAISIFLTILTGIEIFRRCFFSYLRLILSSTGILIINTSLFE
jgi:hypothetical protein